MLNNYKSSQNKRYVQKYKYMPERSKNEQHEIVFLNLLYQLNLYALY